MFTCNLVSLLPFSLFSFTKTCSVARLLFLIIGCFAQNFYFLLHKVNELSCALLTLYMKVGWRTGILLLGGPFRRSKVCKLLRKGSFLLNAVCLGEVGVISFEIMLNEAALGGTSIMLALRRQRQKESCEGEAGLVYKTNSRQTMAT